MARNVSLYCCSWPVILLPFLYNFPGIWLKLRQFILDIVCCWIQDDEKPPSPFSYMSENEIWTWNLEYTVCTWECLNRGWLESLLLMQLSELGLWIEVLGNYTGQLMPSGKFIVFGGSMIFYLYYEVQNRSEHCLTSSVRYPLTVES